jgi:hypothetical protein
MKPETAASIKFGVWGGIIGASVAMTIGFAWGGWSTSSKTQEISDHEVLESQAAICVAQFMRQSDNHDKLIELGKLDSWKRDEFVEKAGFDKMPGQEKAEYGVSRVCTDALELLIKT